MRRSCVRGRQLGSRGVKSYHLCQSCHMSQTCQRIVPLKQTICFALTLFFSPTSLSFEGWSHEVLRSFHAAAIAVCEVLNWGPGFRSLHLVCEACIWFAKSGHAVWGWGVGEAGRHRCPYIGGGRTTGKSFLFHVCGRAGEAKLREGPAARANRSQELSLVSITSHVTSESESCHVEKNNSFRIHTVSLANLLIIRRVVL